VDPIKTFFETLYNVPDLIRMVGVVGVAFIVFSETGLMVGFFLPGDSLLVTAGVLTAGGFLTMPVYTLIPILIVAAIVGDATGYWIGARAGQALYSRPDSLLFRREHLIKTRKFYEKHGGKTIIIARFMPVARTFAPVVAGAAGMTYRRFAMFNVVGGIGWVTSMTLTGYLLGSVVPDIEKRIHYVVAIVIFLSLLPAIISITRSKLQNRSKSPASR
jgi:membrane-associated protein